MKEKKHILKIIEHQNIGHARYVVNYFTGRLCGDGSEFYDMRIFSNKKDKAKFLTELRRQYLLTSNNDSANL